MVWVLSMAGFVQALPIVGLQAPQSFILDSSGHQYFIANANGEPGERDNNGFITKLNGEGQVTQLQFIQGGHHGTVLHSPYGMVVVKNTLYVADLDAIRGFDTTTGKSTVTVSLSRYPNVDLTGLAANQSGVLFAAHPSGNTIYRIDPHQEHHVSVFLQDPSLGGPNGLAFHPRTGHLMIATLTNGTVLEVDGTGSIKEIVSNGFFTSRFHNLSGIAFDRYANMYISDLTAGKIWRIRSNFKMEVIAEFLISPASVSVDREKHLIMVPYLYANGAEINGLEQPVNVGKGKKKKRSLSHYGLGWREGDKAK